MLKLLSVLLFLPIFSLLADDTPQNIVSPLIQNLANPTSRPEIASVHMACTSHSAKAQESVQEGLNHLLSHWDFEAYRHFAHAAELDPDCLMAYWGISCCLAPPGPTFQKERATSFKKLKSLIEAGVGSPIEQELAHALAALYAEGAGTSGQLFAHIAEKYRAAALPSFMGAIMLRDGFDPDSGEPNPGQARANQLLQQLENRNLISPALRFMQSAIEEAAPNPTNALHRMQDLVIQVPNYGPYLLLLGHFEFRSGLYEVAAAHFTQARIFFESYCQKEGVLPADCPSLYRAQAFEVAALELAGKSQEALKLAQSYRFLPIDPTTLSRPGNLLLAWELHSLAARLAISRGDYELALLSLPGPKDPNPLKEFTPAPLYWQFLREYAEARLCLKKSDLKTAKIWRDRLDKLGQEIEEKADLVMKDGSLAEWTRALILCKRLSFELRAAIAETQGGKELSSARIWLQSAIDNRTLPNATLPPALFYPSELPLLYLETKNAGDPNKIQSLIKQVSLAFPLHPQLKNLQKDQKSE